MPADQVPQVFPAPVLEWVAQKGWRLPTSATVVSAQQHAVSDSVYSLRGKLPVPEMAFADRAVGAPNLPADTKSPAPPPRVPAPGTADRG
jgi:hypothetical protein